MRRWRVKPVSTAAEGRDEASSHRNVLNVIAICRAGSKPTEPCIRCALGHENERPKVGL